MDKVREFYSVTGAWWARADARVTERDASRVEALRSHAGPGVRRVLELGAGYGATAVATARAGYAVTAVELSDRADHAAGLATGLGAGSLTFHKADFHAVRLDGRFDAVTYWNGFGIGADADQRRLLHRIADHWLAPAGVALVDVFNPFVWAGWDGDEEHLLPDPEAGYDHELYERTRFDPVTCAATDTWRSATEPGREFSQTLRCYTPADLALLLAGTGLELADVVVGGRSIGPPGAPAAPSTVTRELLHQHHEYLAVLRHAPA
ncbi:class I SAM-dependent methyltransferase [Streptomyces sp. AC536]|uniref:class I SAM-dependent methyltransferase n=1 Tax=Streptomyces buecherae TaxID=2763006 RepID=UPI00164DDE51|nr:class I SAM-dependent methyltransferase [Streptomyces buecherae]MBC3984358.1 class I SAM-dependent methyltransferase [Streptomyces buecherae]QNJ39971.1 class I SAM-dependent methyltransferase [Streptomyces buecherae]